MFSLGLGTAQACGHVDYYPNSGKNQPGCDKNPLEKFQLEHYDIYNGKNCYFTPDRRQSNTLFTFDERGSKSLETVFSIAICRQSGDEWH